MLKILAYGFASIAILFLIAIVAGMALPKSHTAMVRVRIRQPPQRVYDAIVDVANAKSWRSGLESVEITSQRGEPLAWKETASYGTLSYAMDLASPPHRIATRITDTSQGFGGGWTYEIAPDPSGSVVTITENGEVTNPLFRFMSKYVFGQYKSLETYAKDLGRHFGETAEPERVTR
jgi:hypothetical protein